jgi:hypothetical protein
LLPVPKFCACAQAQISHHAKILKTEQQQNMERTHGSDIDTQNTEQISFQLFFPSFTKKVAIFPTWIHLSMAGSHDLRSENCVEGASNQKPTVLTR